jgi:hypothetical protein
MSVLESFTIDNVYPWGRTFDEYCRMFALTQDDLNARIASFADGPASFNAELTGRGGRVVSFDPLYRFAADDIRARVEATREVMLDLTRRDAHRFVWGRIESPEALGALRTAAMETFLADYDAGRVAGRYLDASLPRVDVADDAFDLALCAHFLFLYAAEFSLAFHIDAVAEMLRVAPDVRIFPLLDMRGEPSPHVEPVIEAMRERGFCAERRRVDYEFQRGGNEMLRITR